MKFNMNHSTCDNNCTALSALNFKNYMRFGKKIFPSTIWFQLGVPSSICLEVTKERRQP